MWKDPIVDEVRKNRHEIEVRYGTDSKAYFEHLEKLQKQYKARLIRKPDQKKKTASQNQPGFFDRVHS